MTNECPNCYYGVVLDVGMRPSTTGEPELAEVQEPCPTCNGSGVIDDPDDTLYIQPATSEALITAGGFTRGEHSRYVAPTGEKYWVRSEAAQHAIRIILNQQETRA